jgi:hypothetical protein
VKQANPAASNLLEKRKQMKERRLKRAEGASAATLQESPQQEGVSRNRKMEMVKRHRAHKQAQSKSTNEDQNQSPRSIDNEETDDDTLVSVRRIVANSSQDHHYQSSSNSNPSPYHQQPQIQIQPQTQYQSNYNSLSDNMHSLQQYSKVNKKSIRSSRQKQSQAEQRYGLDQEKSDKLLNRGGAGGSSSFLTASSSEYDTDKESQLTGLERQSFSDANDYTTSPANNQKNDDNYYSSRSYPRRLNDDDDRTFDYGDRDDDDENYSADSGSYAARRLKESERRKMLAAEIDSPKADSTAGNISESPFINKEDAEHFRKKIDSINSPAMRIAAGVAGAATIGVLVGPVGLLVGAAALSIGFSVSQIPEEDRGKLQTKAAASFHELQEKACDASESLGNTCATHYHESGVAEHIPPQVVEHLPQCLSNADGAVLEEDDGVVAATTATNANNKASADKNLTMDMPSHGAGSTGMGSNAGGRGQPSGGDPRLPSPTKPERPHPKNKRNKKVACLRNGKCAMGSLENCSKSCGLANSITVQFSSHRPGGTNLRSRSCGTTKSVVGCRRKCKYIS